MEASTDPDEAATLLWLDAFTANVDRSWRNPNLLVWHGNLWVIDHGAALYFHHGWAEGVGEPSRFARRTWDVTDHVMEKYVEQLPSVDEQVDSLLGTDVFVAVLDQIPDAWLEPVPGAATHAAVRAA